MAVESDPTARAGHRLIRSIPVLVLALGLPFTLWQYQRMHGSEVAAEQAHFTAQTGDLLSALDRRLSTNGDILRGVAGLFASSQAVDRQEFHTYVTGLELKKHYPGIQGVGFAVNLTQADVPAHEQSVRAQGYPEYRIRPLGERDRYTSIVYLEPFDWRNQRAFGFDMYSEAVRRQAMDQAMRTGEVTMTTKVRLVQETESDVQPGFLIYVPIYKKGQVIDTEAQRLQALQGWAYSPLRAKDMLDSMLNKEFAAILPHLWMKVYASQEENPDQLLYEHVPVAGPYRELLSDERRLELFGQHWLVKVSLPVGVQQDIPYQGSDLILLAGLLFTLTMSGVAWWVQRHQVRLVNALAETMRAKQTLEENEAALRLSATVMEFSPQGMIVTDEFHRIVKINPAFTHITGFTEQEAIGAIPRFLRTPTQNQEFFDRLWDTVAKHGSWEGELDNRRKDGSIYPENLTITRVCDKNGQVTHYVGLFTDITARRQAEERIRHLAMHDYLTGLPNRAFFVERANMDLAMAKRYNTKLALLFMDLDKFKPVNDDYGHEAGDAVLVEMARRMRGMLRESDMVCRLGGDEFVVLLADYRDAEGLMMLAHKLADAIRSPMRYQQHELCISCSMGIATFPEHGYTLDELILSADTAMYRSKAAPDHPISMAENTIRKAPDAGSPGGPSRLPSA